MITASRRAKATIAFFIPRRLAICIAQALSQDHFVERTSMLWAASYSIMRIMSSPHREIAHAGPQMGEPGRFAGVADVILVLVVYFAK